MRGRALFKVAATILAGACAPHQSPVAFDLRPASTAPAEATVRPSSIETSYSPVTDRAAVLLGCDVSPDSPICATAIPNAEEDSAFRAEGERLILHRDLRCRRLGAGSIRISRRCGCTETLWFESQERSNCTELGTHMSSRSYGT